MTAREHPHVVPPAVMAARIGAVASVRAPSRTHALLILQLFALTAMVFPADTVIDAVGAPGYVAGLIGLFAVAVYAAATVLGLHKPLQYRHPIRGVLCFLWLSTMLSYVAMDRTKIAGTEILSADRWLMQLAVISAVALLAAECLTSLYDVRRLLRSLTWGGAFCGLVAALQFWINFDLAEYLRMLPGFTLNHENPAIIARGGLNRVQGTATIAIELGVVAGMLLPLAIYLGLYDTERSAFKRWTPVALIGLAIAVAVSRSGVIAVILGLGMLIPLMPARQRLLGLAIAPFGLTAVFMSAPGLIGTLTGFFEAGSSDDSVRARLIDYPVVERLVHEAPWLGHGGGTYIPENTMYILDNQFLKTAIELGLLGVVALAVYFLVPMASALIARRRSRDPELRLLCAALAGPAAGAAACSITFDSLSFPMFSCVYALVLGLIGAAWRLAAEERTPERDPLAHIPTTASGTGWMPPSPIRPVRSAGG